MDGNRSKTGQVSFDQPDFNYGVGIYEDKACRLVRETYGIMKCTECPRTECLLETYSESYLDKLERGECSLDRLGQPNGLMVYNEQRKAGQLKLDILAGSPV